ncbi:hypothetical protein FRC04_009740 [Tulasnella sp. 424]|nr:hypothetical protein FRC04_009740 [Tulasnella sp. 424]
MGKLNIAHHKSYHPYRRDNIERVRRDEEAARLQQLKDEGKLMMADSEARLDVLRKRSGASRSRRDRSSELEFQQKTAEFPADPLTTPEGHINFFSTIEVSQTGTSSFELERKIKGKEAEKGVAFAPNPQDLRPWYVDAPPNVEGAMSSGDPGPSGTGSGDSLRRKNRDTHRKALHDPLTTIQAQLRSRNSTSLASLPWPLAGKRSHQDERKPKNSSPEESPRTARLAREATERARAEALIR